LNGYASVPVTPWETASGGKAVECHGRPECSASVKLDRPPGRYDIAVQYFDYRDGVSSYSLLLNGKQIAAWKADNTLPTNQPNGDTSTRYVVRGVDLKPGDDLKIEGQPGGEEPAPLDYVSITPEASAARAGLR
jgi:alpha-glucuronidase